MVKRRFIAVLLVLSAGYVRSQDPGTNRVIANVNGKAITSHDVMQRLKKDGVNYAELPESEKEQKFEFASLNIGQEILRKLAAEKSGVVLDPEDLKNKKQEEIEKNYGDRAGFEEFLRQSNLSEDQFDTDFKRRQEMHAWLGVVSGRGGAAKLNRNLRPRVDVSVTPLEMRRFYDENVDELFTFKDAANLRVIQVYFTDGPRGNKSRKLQEVQQIQIRLNTKADFAVQAERYSEHLSKDSGGLIENVVFGQTAAIPEPIEAAVFAPGVKGGDVLGPIEFVSSFWLVKVEQKTEARIVPFAEAQPRVEFELKSMRASKSVAVVLQDLVKDAYISPPIYRRKLEKWVGLR